MERLEAVEILRDLCQCCFKMLEDKIDKTLLFTLDPLHQTFSEFFNVKLGNGLICKRCRTYLETFRDFKAEVQASRAELLLSHEFEEVKEDSLESRSVEKSETVTHQSDNQFKETVSDKTEDEETVNKRDIQLLEEGIHQTSWIDKVPTSKYIKAAVNLEKIKTKEEQLQCDHCPNQFLPCKQSLIRHFNSVHFKKKQEDIKDLEVENIKCQEIEKLWRTRREIKFYQPKNIKTDRRADATTSLRKLNIQFVKEVARTSPKSDKIYCPICNKVLKASSLPNHLKLHRGEKELNFMCEICSKQFSSNSALISHRRSHTKNKPYQCDLCTNKFFSSKDSVSRHHQTIHLKQKRKDSIPQNCELCDKTLLNSYLLQSHMKKVHPNGLNDGLKVNPITGQFHCETCKAQYSTRHYYDNHVCLSGANDGAHQTLCLICSTHCTSRAELLRHIQKVHAERIDDSKWRCLICSSIILEKIVLHVESVHTGMNSKCSYCNKELKNRRCLRNHIYVVHENGSEIRKQKRKMKKLLLKTEKL